jgi:hypothetical protein
VVAQVAGLTQADVDVGLPTDRLAPLVDSMAQGIVGEMVSRQAGISQTTISRDDDHNPAAAAAALNDHDDDIVLLMKKT